MFVWFENSGVVINAEDVSRAYLGDGLFVMKDGREIVVEDKEDIEKFKAYVLDEETVARLNVDAWMREEFAGEWLEAPECVCPECRVGLDATEEFVRPNVLWDATLREGLAAMDAEDGCKVDFRVTYGECSSPDEKCEEDICPECLEDLAAIDEAFMCAECCEAVEKERRTNLLLLIRAHRDATYYGDEEDIESAAKKILKFALTR